MKNPNSLQLFLHSVAVDIEKVLSNELDNHTHPTHQFTSNYQKRKLQNLRKLYLKQTAPYIKWRIFLMFMIVLVILLYCIEYLQIKK